ncbi:MAG: isoprenylcysteine carboxylmethyltransferase family protein [Leptolyngbyaceae cyanobacterium RU_5_1]|nr:isoprenylcysteine carboxylmethyltransferase family protein [Leptolyngbyaceae cyanobacterium RU_5_1]
MTITIFLAYLLVGVYFVMEQLQRKTKLALSLQAGQRDRGSSRLLLVSGSITIVFLLLAPVLNSWKLGCWGDRTGINWLGILMMVSGLILRYLAARTLGEFYTRTLLVTPEQHVIEQGLYRIIRHPGYLGLLIASIGVGLATANWIVTLIILVTQLIGLGYRIASEEEMLEAAFGNQYRTYMDKTWRLIPLIY